MDVRAVKAQARFPRCSSVCSCIPRLLVRSGPELLRQYLGDKVTDLPYLTHLKSLFQLRISVSAFGDLGQEQAKTEAAKQSP